MDCKNFVCLYSEKRNGKIICNRFDIADDCKISATDFCGYLERGSCYNCALQNICYEQREKGLFYNSENGGLYVLSACSDFARLAQQNDMQNIKLDICRTACNNFRQGYKTSTTVNYLFDKYGKDYPQFTKDYLRTAVEKCIVLFLKYGGEINGF